jgi:DNA-directed RNA polymerase specialized sigma subunit
MTSKEYLGQAYRIDQRINSKLEQVYCLREMATKATYTFSDMPRNPNLNIDSMANIICKIVDLEREINADIDTLVDLKREIVGVIKAIKNPEYQTLLELRYLCFRSWEQIAVTMDYSLQHIFRLHDKALNMVTIPKHDG